MDSLTETSAIGNPLQRPLGIRKKPKVAMYGQVEYQSISQELSPKIVQGDFGEGGGQVIRYAVLLSILNNIPLQLERIRAGKFPGGLREEHLHTVVMLAKLCQAKLTGAYLGSKGISMIPNASFCVQDMEIDTESDASVTLMAQSALPIMLFASPIKKRNAQGDLVPLTTSSLTLVGATDKVQAPLMDYFTQVFLRLLRKYFNINAQIREYKRGFSPKGNGFLKLEVESIFTHEPDAKGIHHLKPVNIVEPCGKPVRVKVSVFRCGGGFPSKSENICMDAAVSVLNWAKRSIPKFADMRISQQVKQETHYSGFGDGLGILMECECQKAFLASSAIGNPAVQQYLQGQDAKNKTMQEVQMTGQRAAQDLIKLIEVGAPVDTYMQDQLILYMAMAKGTSRVLISEPTTHTLTAIQVCQQLIDCRFNILEPGEGPNKHVSLYLMVCVSTGIGVQSFFVR